MPPWRPAVRSRSCAAIRNRACFDYLGVASGPNDVELQYIETGLFDAVITHNRYTLMNTNADPVIDAAAQTRHGGAECGALWKRHAVARTRFVSALCLPASTGII